MSLRFWSTSYERRLFRREADLFEGFLQYVMTELDDDDDDSSVSSLSSMSDSDDGLDFDEDDLFTNTFTLMARHLMQRAHKILDPLVDNEIEFGQRKQIADFNDSQCKENFRWRKAELQEMADALWPRVSPFLGNDKEDLALKYGYRAPYETCLLIYLFRMSRPHRLRSDAEKEFGMRRSHISACVQTFSAALFQLSHQYLIDPRIWHARMPYYAERVERKCHGLMSNIWGFVDGTIRRTCRPIYYQNLVYTKYKKCHGLKFQSIVVPDGYIAYLYGPFVAKRHDARMLRESGLMDILRGLMPADGSNGPVYALYGDLAYPQSIWLFGGYVNPAPGSLQRAFNR